MYFSDSRIVASIAEQLSGLSRYVTVINSMGLYDINKGAEDFFCHLLNIGLGLRLENLNTIKPNYPAIDLGDTSNRICIQVTSENTSSKLLETLRKFEELNFSKDYGNLIFLVISDKPPPKVKSIPNTTVETWSVVDLSKTIVNGADSNKLQHINEFLKQALKSSVEPTASILPPMIMATGPSGNFDALIANMGLTGDPDVGMIVEEIRNLHEVILNLTTEERAFLYLVLRFGKDPERGSGYYGEQTLAPAATVDSRAGGVHAAINLYRSLQSFDLLSFDNEYQPDQEGPYVPVYSARYYGKTEANILTAIRRFCAGNDGLLRRVIAQADFEPLC
jgi:hypothetical protein